jgi:hypothetical protein
LGGTWEEREEWQKEGCLVVYAAVVRRDIVGVEKDAFLHCDVLAGHSISHVYVRTSLEAGDRRGHFNSAGQKIGKGRKERGQRQSHCRRSSKEEPFLLRSHD